MHSSSLLDQLRQYTTVVADTGNFHEIAQFAPRDATTNPSLILQAAQRPEYASLVTETSSAHLGEPVDLVVDHLLVRFGLEILAAVPGRVSTEVDARLSFDIAGTLERARRIVRLYEAAGVSRDRMLIKIASTWEGIRAAEILEKEGIHCNLTLVFSFCQAVVCGNAGVRLISPFVGRIYDWSKKEAGAAWDESANGGSNDPGVRSVASIYSYYKSNGICTEVMGASFRNIGQIVALAGCDLLTISPSLLAELQRTKVRLARALPARSAHLPASTRQHLDEKQFRWALNEDAMATQKLAEGIRAFAADATKLDRLIESSRIR